jgi:hypothetical protein
MARKKGAAKGKLVVTIVVDGENIMGNPVCEMHGIVLLGKKVEHLEYSGPVVAIPEVAAALKGLFKEE